MGRHQQQPRVPVANHRIHAQRRLDLHQSLRNPDKYITEKGVPLKTDILHSPLPKGPAGQFGLHTFFSHMLTNYSTNQQARRTC